MTTASSAEREPSWPQRWLGRPYAVEASVVLLYTVVSVVFTWPLALGPDSLAPAHFDPPFTAWRLGWVAHQLIQGHGLVDFGRLFDGNIFWPDRRTLAYSDAVLLQGILGTPLVALGMPIFGVVNLLTFVALVGSAFSAYLLAHRLTGHRGAAFVAGLIFAFSPYRRVHLPHLELQWAQWMPLAFWAWHRLLDTGRMRDGLLCTAAILLQLLSSIYYAVFLAVGLVVVGGITLATRRFRIAQPALLGLLVGTCVLAIVAAAYGRPYAMVRPLLGDRTLEETTRYSAVPRSFVTTTKDSLVYRHLLPHDGEGETELFPGVTPVLLAGVALVPPASAAVVAYVATLGLSADLSLGPNGFGYSTLRAHVGAFKALRAPGRFGILIQLSLGVLAAMGLARLARRYPRAGPVLVVAASAAILVEYSTRPLVVQQYSTSPPPVYAWLATEPTLVTLELPTPEPNELPFLDPFYMFASTWHWQPLINGYSGHYSRRYLDIVEMMPRLPGPDATDELTKRGVQRILVHGGMMKPYDYLLLTTALERHPMFHLVKVSADHLGEVRVYAFLPGFGRPN